MVRRDKEKPQKEKITGPPPPLSEWVVTSSLVLLLLLAVGISIGFARGIFDEGSTLILSGVVLVLVLAILAFWSWWPGKNSKD